MCGDLRGEKRTSTGRGGEGEEYAGVLAGVISVHVQSLLSQPVAVTIRESLVRGRSRFSPPSPPSRRPVPGDYPAVFRDTVARTGRISAAATFSEQYHKLSQLVRPRPCAC